MSRKLTSLLLLVTLVLAGCGSAPAVTETAPALHWDGAALTGATFFDRVMPQVTVHYAEPTLPSTAERIGTMIGQFLDEQQAWGRLLPGERVELWVIPEGYAWPQELPPLDRHERLARAVKPRVMVMAERLIPRDARDKYSLDKQGVFAALATAVTQGENSPAYAVGWLHDGMGGAFTQEWRHFPGGLFARDFTGTFNSMTSPRVADEILVVLDGTRPPIRGQMSYLEAATGLAGLLMDRWGIDWPEQYPRTPEQLTPEAALMWATGAQDRQTASSLATGRMMQVIRFFGKYAVELNYRYSISHADNGKNRLPPKIGQLPTEPTNKSAVTYRIAVDWDPATRTVAGEERLTWTNGAGVPIDHLYFNVWGNSTPVLRYGGNTRVEAVAVDGEPAAFTFRGMDLEVPLGRQVGPGQSTEVSVRFATRLAAPIPPPPHIGVYNPLVRGTNAQSEEVWPLSLWYPALARLDAKGWHLDSFPESGVLIADRADYEVRVTTPPGSSVSWKYIDTQVTTEGERTVYQSRYKGELEWTGRILVQK